MTNKEKFTKLLIEAFALSKKISFTDIKLKDGSILRTADEALKEGSKVTLVSAEGVETKVADGDVTAEDGSTITIKSEVVEKLNPAPSPEAQKAETPEATTTAPDAGKKEEKLEAPVTTPAAEENQNAEDMDNQMLIDTIKNLIARVAALEESYSSTSLAVEKMSAKEQSKTVVPDTYGDFKVGTVGYELAKFDAERKAKKAKQSMENILKVTKEVSFKAGNPIENKNEPRVETKEIVNPLLGFNGGFEVSGI